MTIFRVVAARVRGIGSRRRRVACLVSAFAVAAGCGALAGAADATIYWANVSANTIGAANNDGSNVNQRFITGASGPSSVVVYGPHLYWANANQCTASGSCAGSIAVANLDGTGVNEKFIPATTPFGVAVDGQHIYWTTWTQNSVPSRGTIGEADLNGTGVNDNLVSSANTPVGVAVTTGSLSGGSGGAVPVSKSATSGSRSRR